MIAYDNADQVATAQRGQESDGERDGADGDQGVADVVLDDVEGHIKGHIIIDLV